MVDFETRIKMSDKLVSAYIEYTEILDESVIEDTLNEMYNVYRERLKEDETQRKNASRLARKLVKEDQKTVAERSEKLEDEIRQLSIKHLGKNY